jgi:hypothetical protein
LKNRIGSGQEVLRTAIQEQGLVRFGKIFTLVFVLFEKYLPENRAPQKKIWEMERT